MAGYSIFNDSSKEGREEAMNMQFVGKAGRASKDGTYNAIMREWNKQFGVKQAAQARRAKGRGEARQGMICAVPYLCHS